MALPVNSNIDAGTIPESALPEYARNRVRIYEGPARDRSGQPLSVSALADLEARALAGSQQGFQGSSGSGNYAFGISGKPRLSGLDKALGALGAGIAVIEGIKGLANIGLGIANTVEQLANQAIALGDSLVARARATIEEGAQGVRDAINDQVEEALGVTAPKIDPEDWRVRITTNINVFPRAFSGYLAPLRDHGGVIFPYTPQITVNHKANYSSVDPVHSNFPFLGYKNSQVDDIQISGLFSCNTQNEGLYWIAATQFFKTATKSFYGISSPQGHPPIVCKLDGYGTHMFNEVPVVIKSFAIELPRNVQYKRINVDNQGQWVPMESTLTVTVAPIFNREKLRRFSLNDYANGNNKGIL